MGGFENDIGNRMSAMEPAMRENHAYVSRLAQTIQALSDTVEFERQRNAVLEGRMDEYQRLGFNINQSLQRR